MRSEKPLEVSPAPTSRHGALFHVVEGQVYGLKGVKFDRVQRKVLPDGTDPSSWVNEFFKDGVSSFDYARLFSPERADNLLSEKLLRDLGEKMFGSEEDTRDELGVTSVPAAYTYFGQFIAHELSHLAPDSGAAPHSLASPTFDLGSIFDAQAGGSADELLPLGDTSAYSDAGPLRQDLPRGPSSGCPAIGDARNDDNVPLAQTHVALMKFVNNIARALPDLDVPAVQRIAIRHFQSVVLHDYSQRLIEPNVFEDIIKNGRAIFLPDAKKSTVAPQDFQLPIEFVLAFRFGHSMIRNRYELWTGYRPATLLSFWANTYNSNQNPASFSYLDAIWVNNWLRILPFWRTKYRQQQLAFESGLPAAISENPISAAPIDTQLAYRLSDVPQSAAPRASDLPANLAARTLLRHHVLRLRDGRQMAQETCDRLRARHRPEFPVLSPAQIIDGEPCFERLGRHKAQLVADKPPLWFYVLKEAKLLGSGGRTLGPLGSRIVMESLHAAIEFSAVSILGEGSWAPDPRLRPTDPTRYTLPDLIAFAGHPAPLIEAIETFRKHDGPKPS